MKPRLWATIVLPKPHELPGYAEAVAAIERGESPFPEERKRDPQPKRPRAKRTLASLIDERLTNPWTPLLPASTSQG